MTKREIVKALLALMRMECQAGHLGSRPVNPERVTADLLRTMSTIGFRSNILFAIAAAFGVVASLGRPWYGPSNPATDAQMEDLFGGIGRSMTESGGTDGWTALATADQLLAGFALLTVVL